MAASDERLASKARQGSAEAFGELVQRFERPIVSLIARIVRDRALAEDLAQEAFVRAWQKLEGYDPARPFRSWMFKVAHNLTVDALRKAKLETVPLETPGEESVDRLTRLEDDAQAAPDDRAHQRRALRTLERAIGALRPQYREVLLLRFREGLSYEEIGEALSLPLGTVKTHLHRGRQELAHAMETAGYGDEWT